MPFARVSINKGTKGKLHKQQKRKVTKTQSFKVLFLPLMNYSFMVKIQLFCPFFITHIKVRHFYKRKMHVTNVK